MNLEKGDSVLVAVPTQSSELGVSWSRAPNHCWCSQLTDNQGEEDLTTGSDKQVHASRLGLFSEKNC